jgi:hypothetical protein
MGSLTVSLTPSLNPKMTLTKFLRHVTRRVSFYFFYFIFSIIFIFYLHIFVYILSVEPVHTDSTRSSLKPVFFCPTLQFSRRLSVKKKNPKKIHTARLPHVYRTCGCEVNLPHNRTYGAESLVSIISNHVRHPNGRSLIRSVKSAVGWSGLLGKV